MLPKGRIPQRSQHVIAFISYDEATHTFTKENVQLMDSIDFYATQTTLPRMAAAS